MKTNLLLTVIIGLFLALLWLSQSNHQLADENKTLKDQNESYQADERYERRFISLHKDDRVERLLEANVHLWDSHLPARPMYVFDSLTIPWASLFPDFGYVSELFPAEELLLGTFPVASNYEGSNIEQIVVQQHQIILPDWGEYYLHTRLGHLKLLSINPGSTDDERIVAICRFISGNTVHSLADMRTMMPLYPDRVTFPDRLLPVLFTSDQPLKLHCGPIASFACWLFNEKGYEADVVQLKTSDQRGHVAIQVHFPVLDKDVFVDLDFGMLVMNQDGQYLSIEEIKAIFENEEGKALDVLDLSGKSPLQEKYNLTPVVNDKPLTPQFNWTPACSQDRPYTTKSDYMNLLKEYTHHVVVSAD